MKTPEQIAEDYADTIRWDTRDRAVLSESEMRALIRDAIEADRAQRQADADEASAWAAEVYQNLREPDYDSTESWDNDSLAECAAWAARKALGVPAWEGEGA